MVGDRVCCACKKLKPLDQFHKTNDRKSGVKSSCKECRKQEYKTHKGQRRNRRMERLYDMTSEIFALILASQDNACAICKNKKSNVKRDWFSVDHCHETGIVRGLLCNSCNIMLGNAKDDVVILANAIKYLEKSNDK